MNAHVLYHVAQHRIAELRRAAEPHRIATQARIGRRIQGRPAGAVRAFSPNRRRR